jgi:hypothetical protein
LSFRACILQGLNADSAIIETNLLIINGCETHGEVSLRGADIGGDIRTDGSTFNGSNNFASVCSCQQHLQSAATTAKFDSLAQKWVATSTASVRSSTTKQEPLSTWNASRPQAAYSCGAVCPPASYY